MPLAIDFAWVIQMLEVGIINIVPWITHYASTEEIIDQFPRWLKPETGVVKAMLVF